MGIPLDEMAVWDPWAAAGSAQATREHLAPAAILLWKGHCSVHQRFLPEPCRSGAREVSGHPGDRASGVPLGGLPEGRCAGLDRAPDRSGGRSAGGNACSPSGTEIHLVNRLARRFAAEGKKIITLDDTGLPVHHHVSHQPAAPGVGAGESGRRPRGESHPGEGKCEALGTRGAGPDAGNSIAALHQRGPGSSAVVLGSGECAVARK